MSDWSAIVREVAGKSLANAATASTPLLELTELMGAGSDAHHALEVLTTMRNDQAHHRGPKGGQVGVAFGEALEHLVALYGECEWLVDYPVRLIEDVVWDSYSNVGRYAYRELVGDHYLVPEQVEETKIPTLDKGRLYVTDRAGTLHLLSPLVHWHECDHCHVPSAFFLDGFDRRAGTCRMRAMDHNHAITTTEVVGPLIRLGLLPSEDGRGPEPSS